MRAREQLERIMDIDYTTDKPEAIAVSNDIEFEDAKRSILKCFYTGLHIRDSFLSVVCDNGKYYVIDMDSVDRDNLVNTFSFLKPKKIVYDIENYKSILTENSKGFIDIRLAINLLYNKDYIRINQFIADFKIPPKARSNIYVLYANLIKVAKNMNIYTEKNGLNKAYYTEMDTAILMGNISKRGVDLNISVFEEIKNNTNKDIKNITNEAINKYGNEFDFEDKQKVLKAVKEGSRSLDPMIMKVSENPLYDEYNKYKWCKWIKSLNVVGDKMYLNYSLYDDYQIKSDLSTEGKFYGNETVDVIKGEFGSLYYKVFAELTRNDSLIVAASKNNFIGYVNDILFYDGHEGLSVYTDVILRCYANGVFDHFEVQKYAIENYDTVLNVGDISNFNHRLESYFGSFYTFIKEFDGLSPEYDRYSKKIFTPECSLDGYIKQIINRIFKTSLLEIEELTRDYSEKRKKKADDSLTLCGVGKDLMLLSATGEDAKQMAIDNLNRVMYKNYKYFIRNTKVYNTTSTLGA